MIQLRHALKVFLVLSCLLNVVLLVLYTQLNATNSPLHVVHHNKPDHSSRSLAGANVDSQSELHHESPPTSSSTPSSVEQSGTSSELLSTSSLSSSPTSHSTHLTTQVHTPITTSYLQESTCGVGPWDDKYPHCQEKMDWMKQFWKSDQCYASLGVVGTDCSFQIYLSEVEHWCPPVPGRPTKQDGSLSANQLATLQRDIHPLISLMSYTTKLEWPIGRIKRLWPNWVAAIDNMNTETPFKHKKLQILVHIGALTDYSGFKLAESAGKGGPLGELVQWSDLIAVLYILGHGLTISTEHRQLRGLVRGGSACPGRLPGRQGEGLDKYDVVFLDITGVREMKVLKVNLNRFSCKFRVLDSFGTDPQFNFRHWKPSGEWRVTKNPWGNLGLYPRQFYTMFPHSPDNSFMGFVVGNAPSSDPAHQQKTNRALVYGKYIKMWKDKHAYLDALHDQGFEIHATVHVDEDDKNRKISLPSYVINHGVVSGNEIQQLLKESKVFVGLGFPYEGPAPLEAVANGCFFINPKIDPPIGRKNSAFFKQTPNFRKLTSQHPYMEQHVGKPHVYTIDISDSRVLRQTVTDIKNSPAPAPYLPREFTYEGMIERLEMYLTNQQFCPPRNEIWPPESELHEILSKQGESCKDTCLKKGMVCEPEFFPLLNTADAFKRHNLTCSYTNHEHSIHGPSQSIRRSMVEYLMSSNPHTECSLQRDKLLLSCVGYQEKTIRLCPCRHYQKGQIALCPSCTRQ